MNARVGPRRDRTGHSFVGDPQVRPSLSQPRDILVLTQMSNLFIAIGDLHGHYRAHERILDAVQKKYGIFGAGGEGRLRPGVQFIFSGHTPHRAMTIYGKWIFDIDVGVTPEYGENMPQALVFTRKAIAGLRADGTGKEFVRFGASSA